MPLSPRFARLRFSVLALLCAPFSSSALDLELPQLIAEADRRAVIDYRADGEVEIQWQFSQDDGAIWRPVQEHIARVTHEASPLPGYSGRTGVAFPGEFPGGLSLRARFRETGSDAPQLSQPFTIPHRTEFPSGQRELTLPTIAGAGFSRFQVEGDLLVASYALQQSAGGFRYETFSRAASGWTPAPSLRAAQLPDFPAGFELGPDFALVGGQLLVATGAGSSIARLPDGKVYVFDWSGPASGWTLRQTISRPPDAPSGPAGTDFFGARMYATESYLLVDLVPNSSSRQVDQGSLFVYQRSPGGDWQLDGQLSPEATGDASWRLAAMDPVEVSPDVLVTHGVPEEGRWNRFYFHRSATGWDFVGGEATEGFRGFAAGGFWAEVEDGLSDVSNGVGSGIFTELRVYDLGEAPGDLTEIAVGEYPYGYFPYLGAEDWIYFGFEPSYDIALPFGAVVVAPLNPGELHPHPALLVPADTEGYAFIGRDATLAGQDLYVASLMVDDSFAVDRLDLSQLPHPDYPEVESPVWVGIRPPLPVTPGDWSVRYRRPTDPAIVTEVQWSTDRQEWKPFPVSPANTTVVDPDPDGDGRVELHETTVPLQVDNQPVLYRVIDRRVLQP